MFTLIRILIDSSYYITGAPQCVYPDANMQEVLNAASFDAVYVQFCERNPVILTQLSDLSYQDNNYCGLQNFGDPEVTNNHQLSCTIFDLI